MTAVDDLRPERLHSLLRGQRFGAVVHHFDQLDSTQAAALAAAQAGAAEGTLFVAEAQTRGRGRHGHRWDSPPGVGLYFSLVLRPQLDAGRVLLLTLALGLGVADAVAEAAGLKPGTAPEIRWPNDLLLDRRKFCGLMLETASDGGRVQQAILGIGINVRARSFPPELESIATALDLHAVAPVDRARLCAATLAHLERRYTAFQAGSTDLIMEFERRCRLARGGSVVVGSSGAEPYRGVTEGLDPSGFLRVRLAEGEVRLVTGGDVRPG